MKNALVEKLKLTDLQWELLSDRMYQPDCIADALETEFGLVESCCELLWGGKIDEALRIDRELTYDILQDCCDGCTYCTNGMDDEYSHQKCRAIRSSGHGLAVKISEMIGRDVQFCDW